MAMPVRPRGLGQPAKFAMPRVGARRRPQARRRWLAERGACEWRRADVVRRANDGTGAARKRPATRLPAVVIQRSAEKLWPC